MSSLLNFVLVMVVAIFVITVWPFAELFSRLHENVYLRFLGLALGFFWWAILAAANSVKDESRSFKTIVEVVSQANFWGISTSAWCWGIGFVLLFVAGLKGFIPRKEG